MNPSTLLTTKKILEVFTEEITARAGRVTDAFHDGRRLFTRSTFDRVDEVRLGDQVQGGVALKATTEGVCLYPYVFRQVCSNGAIMARATAARSFSDLYEQESEAAVEAIREGIAVCCEPDVFPDTVRKMRTVAGAEVDMALNLLPLLSQLPASLVGNVLPQILERFFSEGDKSQFGLAQAVTSVARDTKDPSVRWNLEEFGGGISIGAVPRQPASGGRAAARRREPVAVG